MKNKMNPIVAELRESIVICVTGGQCVGQYSPKTLVAAGFGDRVCASAFGAPTLYVTAEDVRKMHAAHCYWGFESAIFWGMCDEQDRAKLAAAQLNLQLA